LLAAGIITVGHADILPGHLISIPASAWRQLVNAPLLDAPPAVGPIVRAIYSKPFPQHPLAAVLQREHLSIPISGGLSVRCIPVMSCHALARWMGATVLPPEPTIRPIVCAAFGHPQAPTPDPQDHAPPHKGGRPAHGAQKDVVAELVRLADLDGLLDDWMELVRTMVDWCADKFGDKAPSETTIRTWLKLFVQHRY
jgi:hypothetical protein